MEIKYRLVDVEALVCYACQDYLSMIIKNKWQDDLRNMAKYTVENGILEDRPDKYVNIYENMKDIKDYSVQHMDVTIINEIIWNCDSLLIAPVNKSIKHKLSDLASDKNLYSHSHWHESPDELLNRGIVSLDLLKKFVQTVEKKDTTINSSNRIKYRDTYIQKINEMKKSLFEDIKPKSNTCASQNMTSPNHNNAQLDRTDTYKNQAIDAQKSEYTIGGLLGSKKTRLGRVHKKKSDS